MISGPYFINLDHRTDRLAFIESEFARLSIKGAIRVPAILESKGAIGCLKSHILALEQDLSTDRCIWICEDDIQFKVSREDLDLYIREFMESSADILCLGFASRHDIEYSEHLRQSFDLQTASCYLVKSQFKSVLCDFWKANLHSYETNEKNPYKDYFDDLSVHKGEYICTDMSWKVLQQSYIFVIPKVRCVVQRPGFSDIEKNYVDYSC